MRSNELALACTVRVASGRARLQQPGVSVAVVPDGGGGVSLSRLVGLGVAAEAILIERTFDALEALRVGWINAILPIDGFRGCAPRWAATIAAHPVPALHAAKTSVVHRARRAFDDALVLGRRLFAALSATSEAVGEAAG